MVSALNQNGLRVVMDVVYNHTAASGQDDKSVLDKVVPGYYYRYDTNGALYTSSCCSDTAAEYEMLEKLMIDTALRFAVDYKVDGFRFDLMNFHTRQNMLNLQGRSRRLSDATRSTSTARAGTSARRRTRGSPPAPTATPSKYNMTGSGIGAVQRHHPRRGARRLQRGPLADPQAGLHQRPELRLERLHLQQPLPERPVDRHGQAALGAARQRHRLERPGHPLHRRPAGSGQLRREARQRDALRPERLQAAGRLSAWPTACAARTWG